MELEDKEKDDRQNKKWQHTCISFKCLYRPEAEKQYKYQRQYNDSRLGEHGQSKQCKRSKKVMPLLTIDELEEVDAG